MFIIVTTILATLILVAVIIGVHEYGHLKMARLVGVKVIRFSIGFGRQIFSFTAKKSGIEYAVSMFPIGGYVKMLDTREQEVDPKDYPVAFDKQAKWKRFLVIIAGPLANFVFALIALWLVYLVGYQTISPVIPDITPNSPLAKQAVPVNSEIIRVNDYETLDWADVTVRLFQHIGEQRVIPITVMPPNSNEAKTVSLDFSKIQFNEISPDPIKAIGIHIDKTKVASLPKRMHQYGAFDALGVAIDKIELYTQFSLIAILKLLTQKISIKSLSGPLGLVAFAGMALIQGVLTFCVFLAIISIIVGVVNLVPFPGLDGGHLLYLGYEAVSGNTISVALQILLFRLGVIFLSILFVQILINDIVRLTS